jgi:CMP-N,N'-diacetyllegionaminic acid synthase
MKVLVVIPARGGSKRLPNKNIKLLNNKPLIEYTIDASKIMRYALQQTLRELKR